VNCVSLLRLKLAGDSFIIQSNNRCTVVGNPVNCVSLLRLKLVL
jgi:hypothetical protein